MNALLYRLAYYAAQRLRGERVLSRLREMERNQWRSADEIRARQWRDRRALLEHAWATVPYYRERWRAAGLEPGDIRGEDDWAKLPLLGKDDVRRHGERLRSSRAPAGLVAATSGSSGQPVSVQRSHLSWANAHANTIRGWHWHGIDVGDRYAYLWGVPLDSEARRTAARKDRFFNRTRLSAFRIDRESASAFHRELLARPARWAFGYPSALHAFAEEVAAAGLDGRALRWRAVVTSAEVLKDWQRERIEEVFGCRVADSYGCAEAGGAGFECERGGMHVAMESVVLERHAGADGEHEVLLTDLGNRSQPLIRYQVGDLLGPPPGTACGCGRGLPVIGKLSGRAGDVIELPDGRRLNANLPSYIFKHHARERTVREYQFVQHDDGRVELRVVAGPAWTPAVRERLVGEVREVLKLEADVRPVERIERLGRAKHRDFVRARDLGGTA